ncbi:VOC family protein [Catenuloplanes japonicus]|uniref:glyoxalase n=1 Tax=Catenuloplanes japonicus TaxID=33876 RepID=UPI00052519F5|nr:glyoxalase [Catenuloplanes japonicus]
MIEANETVVPVLPCAAPEQTLRFWRALGATVEYEQAKPYPYLAFRLGGLDVHYGASHGGTGTCLVMVDTVADYHAAFATRMREGYGTVPATGQPRITRFRPGASRFTLTDPDGNSLIFIQRDAPEVEYGGAAHLHGLAKVLDNARTLRESRLDDLSAWRALNSGLRRHADGATPAEIGAALAALIELSAALGEDTTGWGTRLAGLALTPEERDRVRAEVADPALLTPWLSTGPGPQA